MSWPAPDNRHSQLSRSAGLCACLIGILAGDVIAAEPTDPFLAWQSSAAYPQMAMADPERNSQPPNAGNPPADKPPDVAALAGTGDSEVTEPRFNLHAQATIVAQGDPPFAADYSGPNSLNPAGERRADTGRGHLFQIGLRLWHGAELHADGLMWEGFGLSQTFGIEAFPNADAYKAGTEIPDFMFAHLMLRQTFGLGGEQEDVRDDALTLAGKQDVSRLTVTVGRFTPTDIFDTNTYAHDAHTQFLNWKPPAEPRLGLPVGQRGLHDRRLSVGLQSAGLDSALAIRLLFQMPGRRGNGFTADDRILKWPSEGSGGSFWEYWGMMAEFERSSCKINGHPGAVRGMVWLEREANYASYSVATPLLLANPPPPNTPPGAEITIPAAAFAIRNHYGVGLNWEQEVTTDVGVFSRLGWNDGHEAPWTYTDANWSASLGASVKGRPWRPRRHLRARLRRSSKRRVGPSRSNFSRRAELSILNDDGNLTYGSEKVVETYYDFPHQPKGCRFAFDYQFVGDPAFNAARGPVSIFAVRLHWEQ